MGNRWFSHIARQEHYPRQRVSASRSVALSVRRDLDAGKVQPSCGKRVALLRSSAGGAAAGAGAGATVVGTRTYGKGVYQEVEELPNGGALDITVGEYFTPKGRNLGGGGPKRGAGITPDVKAQDNSKTKRDEALDVAVKTAVRGHA